MTVNELRKLIKGLPAYTKVVIGIGENLEDICSGGAGLVCIEFEEIHDREFILVLPMCDCKLQEPDITANGLNSKPELN